jgi:endonuclease YncB( thermonuclease family)
VTDLPEGWGHRHVTLTRIIDADTLVFDIDHGFGVWSRGLRVRILDYDAPEHRSHAGHHANAAEKAHAVQATEAAHDILSGVELKLVTFKGDSFNRWLGKVYIHDGEGAWKDYGEVMTDLGWSKRPFYESSIESIERQISDEMTRLINNDELLDGE